MARVAARNLALLAAFLTCLGAGDSEGPDGGGSGAAPRLVNDRCPVMTEEFTSPLHELHAHGVTVRFCCAKCRRRFESDPMPYLARLPQLTPAAAQAFLGGSQADVRAQRANAWLDRWMRPALLVAASLLAAWLVARVARRRRLVPPAPALPAEPSETPPGE